MPLSTYSCYTRIFPFSYSVLLPAYDLLGFSIFNRPLERVFLRSQLSLLTVVWMGAIPHYTNVRAWIFNLRRDFQSSLSK
ncbi:hypothetical protein VNO77_18590 [Canavalia gladiata]|uniref:Uncharacterized protein n=1 Tax=Canavalia gladiata TaxID=3824 RepID=A0AAN9LL78_CANGL